MKGSKYHFFRKEVKFLGHVVSENGINTDPQKTEVKNGRYPHVKRSYALSWD